MADIETEGGGEPIRRVTSNYDVDNNKPMYGRVFVSFEIRMR